MQYSQTCSNIKAKKLTQAQIAAIEAVLAKDERVELIPTKDGVRVIQMRRTEIKTSP